MITLARYVPLDRFVLAMAEGWRFCRPPWHVGGMVVGPMAGNHGSYACLMTMDGDR